MTFIIWINDRGAWLTAGISSGVPGGSMLFLEELGRHEGGRRLILNLHDGLISTADFPVRLAKRLLEEVARSTDPPGPPWYPHQFQVYNSLFDAPARYQYQGPPPRHTIGHWVTIKPVRDVIELLKESPWANGPSIVGHLGPWAASPMPSPKPADCKLLARLLNDQVDPIRFRLAKAFEDKTRASASSGFRMRPGPVWLSRWEDFEQNAPDLSFPSDDAASRIRDWLGLPHERVPLFAFITRESFDISTRLARRPTVLDGISNVLYKHRTSPPRGLDGCGTTADINVLRTPPKDPDVLDGGPEVIARRIWYHPRRFRCIYLGDTPDLRYDPHGPFHVRLLGDRDYDAIAKSVAMILA